MNTEQKDKWRKIRRKGQFRFILSGFLLYGLAGTFLSVLSDYSFEFFFNDAPNYLHASDRLSSKILIGLVLSSLGGSYIKYSEWDKNEKEFFEWNENEEEFFRNPVEK
ncbi:MAG TPA: hypothetical protein VF599_05565 [Pyrinomonadaceae bacterium]|jgi:hypothetical protein